MNPFSRVPTRASVVAACLIIALPVAAWQQPAAAQTEAQQIQFSPPVEGTCRAESGSISRGRLVSISELEIVMINTLDRTVSFPTSEITVIRTKDGAFQYEPGSDDFRDAVRRASTLTGVRINTIYVQAPSQVPPNQPGVGPNRPGVGQGSSGFTNIPSGGNNQPMGNPATGEAPVYSSTPGFSNRPSTDSTAVGSTDDGSGMRCASCGNLISADSRLGQKCPHCGVVWVANPDYRPVGVDTTSSQPGYVSTPPAHGATAPAGQPAPAQPTAAPAPVVGTAGNFSFEAMPMWQKAGAFIAFLAVLYLIVSGRR